LFSLPPFLVVIGLLGGLLLAQPDLSTFGIIAIAGLGMYFLAGTPLRHTIFILAMGAVALVMLVVCEPYRFKD